MKKPVALVLASMVCLAACGTASNANSSSSAELDRADAEEVALAFITATMELDIDTMEELVVPDQGDDVALLRAAFERSAELSPPPDIEIVGVSVTVIEQDDEAAVVNFAGEYCFPPTTHEVHVTTVGSDGGGVETIPGAGRVVTEPEQCFDLTQALRTDNVDLQLIDGAWFAQLPE